MYDYKSTQINSAESELLNEVPSLKNMKTWGKYEIILIFTTTFKLI